MSQTGQELIRNKALCRCDKGMLPMPLSVTSQQSHFLQGRLVATSQDKTFPPFGTCLLKNNLPCTPMLLMWQDTFDLVSINGPLSHPLLEKSTIMCGFGGKVSILLTMQLAVPGLPAVPRAEGVRTVFMSLCPLLVNED